MIEKKFIPVSYEDFESKYPTLKSEWLHDNLDADENDFDTFYSKILNDDNLDISSFTSKKIKNFFLDRKGKHLDQFLKDFHQKNNTYYSDQKNIDEIDENSLNVLFEGNHVKHKLFKFLAENFFDPDPRFSDLTKFNQLYRYLNRHQEYNISQIAYKEFIRLNFAFDYKDRQISAEVPKHMLTIEMLEKNYKQ